MLSLLIQYKFTLKVGTFFPFFVTSVEMKFGDDDSIIQDDHESYPQAKRRKISFKKDNTI